MGEGLVWMVALDAITAALLGLVALRFARGASRTHDPLVLLFAAGIGLVALSYPTVAASHHALGAPGLWDIVRVLGQAGGALVVLCAYATARLFGRARPMLAIGWAIAGISLLGAILVYAIPPLGALPSNGSILIVGHAVMVLTWAAAAALAGARLAVRSGRAERAFVPLAFGAFAAGKAAWLALDLGAGDHIIPFVYGLRFLGIALLLSAARPIRRPDWREHATT